MTIAKHENVSSAHKIPLMRMRATRHAHVHAREAKP